MLEAVFEAFHVAPGKQHPGARVLEGVAQLRHCVPLVERNEDHARAGNRLIDLQIPMAVRSHDSNAVTLDNPQCAERADQPPAALPHLLVAELQIAAADGQLCGRDLPGPLKGPDHGRHDPPCAFFAVCSCA